MNLLDYLIGNQDRHRGNFIRRPGGHLVAIDHGVSFGVTGDYQDRFSRHELMPTREVFERVKTIGRSQFEAAIKPTLRSVD